MKIYTKTGDAGQTGLFAGPRVSKDAARIEAYGAVDELNAALGVARAAGVSPQLDALLARIQSELFDLGAELATPDPRKLSIARIGSEEIQSLEAAIDHCEATLAPLRSFILPGGSLASAQLHLARTVCRRAERRLVTLGAEPLAAEEQPLANEPLVYLNRLGDLLFVLARAANQAAGLADIPWQGRSPNR